MTSLIRDLVQREEHRFDRLAYRAYYLAGMKLGLSTSRHLNDDNELLELIDVIYEWQRTNDPAGITWEEDINDQTTDE